jgi:3-hydroxybutyryl-CoA dehydrogenase
MRAAELHSAAVVGAGTMGHGIAQVLALAGIATVLVDASPPALAKGLAGVRANLDKGVERGKVAAAARNAALARLTSAGDLGAIDPSTELVIEAIPERIELKRDVLGRLGARLAPGALLATNTSSLSVSAIAEAVPHPERVVGMHFFNPPHIMKLLEVVRARQSSDEAVACAVELGRRLGKDPIVVTDSPGFASSRLGICIGMEAIRMLEAGVASARDIDKAMVLGYGFPMGPLELTDLVGLDVRLSIAEYLSKELGERFAPPRLLREMVARGELGKKSGRGFYDWSQRSS